MGVFPEVHWGVVEALLFGLLSIALAIGSVQGKVRYYGSAVTHFLFGVTGAIVAALILQDPTSMSTAGMLLATIMMAGLMVWMSTRWMLHQSDIMLCIQGDRTREPRPFLMVGCFEAACLAGIVAAKLGTHTTVELGTGSMVDLTVIAWSVVQFLLYILAAIMLVIGLMAITYHVKQRINHRRERHHSRENTGS